MKQDAEPETEERDDTAVSRPPRRRNPESSKRRILDAAEGAFASRGYDGARLRDIAKEAGVHHALVHHYYSDKRGLFRAVIERALERASSTAMNLVRGNQDLEGSVASISGFFVDFLAGNLPLVAILETAYLNEGSPANQVVREVLGSQLKPLLNGIVERIAEGQRAGVVRTDLEAADLLVMAFGSIMQRFRMPIAKVLFDDAVPAPEERERFKQTVGAFLIAAMRT